MGFPNKRVWVNNKSYTLDGAHNDSTTTLTFLEDIDIPELMVADSTATIPFSAYYTYLTLYNSAGDIEIVKVLSRKSANNKSVLVIRGEQDTTAQSWPSATTVDLKITIDAALSDDTLTHAYRYITTTDVPSYTEAYTTRYYVYAIDLAGGPTDDPQPDISKINLDTLVDAYSYKEDVSTAEWVNDTDDTLADDELIPTAGMVKDYVAGSGGGSASDSFKTIAISGQSDVVADSATDTLTLVAGTNITLTTNATTDTITIAASGGGGSGDFVGPASSADNEVMLFDSTTGKLGKRPGTAGMVIPSGTTGQRGSSNYQLRLNTDTNHAEIRIAGSWSGQQLLTDGDFSGSGFLYKTSDLSYSTVSLGSGVQTFLSTPTSANLRTAMTDETGSGSLVFATSPTLVTPDLGTPSAATLTNATGLPISTGISGLGSNVATFLATPSSANLRAALTDEVGTGAAYFVGGALGTPASGTATNLTGLPLTTGVTGTLAETNGGTNQSTYTTGDMLYASGANTLSKRAIGATGSQLTVVSGAPVWKGGLTAFRAKRTTTQTVTSGATTKVQCNVEDYDTGGYYDNATNYRYTPLVAGKYEIKGYLEATTNAANGYIALYIYKNGAQYARTFTWYNAAAPLYSTISVDVDMNGSTDYIEMYANIVGVSITADTALSGCLLEPS